MERDLAALAQERVLAHFAALGARPKSASEFLFKGRSFNVLTTSDALKPTSTPALLLQILDSHQVIAPRIDISRDINGLGFYKSVDVSVVKSLEHQINHILDISIQVLSIGYRWIEDECARRLLDLHSEFTDLIYANLRRALIRHFGRGDLTAVIWFSVFSEQNGYYVISSEGINAIKHALQKREYYSDLSPLFHLVMLLGLEMPFSKSLSQFAMRDYKRFDLTRAAYAFDMPHILKTEEQMTLKSSYSIFPICDIGPRRLVASFPAAFEQQIRPVLAMETMALTQAYKSTAALMEDHIDRVRSAFRLDASAALPSPNTTPTGRWKRIGSLFAREALDPDFWKNR